jgi:S-adenosylmethionine decarboxylase
MPKTLSNRGEERVGNAVGTHCLLELYDCPQGLLNDVTSIEQRLQEAAGASSSTILQQISHQFSPCGVTAIALLAESHISIHTWPEIGYAAVDVFTCGEATKPQAACDCLIEALQAGSYRLQTIDRCSQKS